MDDDSRRGVGIDADETVESQVAPGEQVGRYRLCFELASGGMATVYLARASGPAGIERIAAIKRIHPHLAKQRSFVDMFLDEARIVSQITHANVCSVLDFGEAEGEYFIAMEYLLGETVSRVIRALRRSGDPGLLRRSVPIALRVIADACEGLHAAHELRDARGQLLGVVHRDVSPQNLFITYDGSTKVVDFGVALARERLHQTMTGEVKGKHAYMAPEQLGGAAIDRRADVWSLGVVLWELLATRHLFKKKTDAETILNVLNAPIVGPSQILDGIPPEVDRIVLRALSRDPEGRYGTARDLGRDLTQALVAMGEPVGLPEVAEWMGELFPDGHVRKKALVDFARGISGPVAKLPEGDPLTGSTSDGMGSGDALTVADSPAHRVGQDAPRRRRAPIIVAALLGLLLLGAAGGLLALGGSRPRGMSQVTASLRPSLARPWPSPPPGRGAKAAPTAGDGGAPGDAGASPAGDAAPAASSGRAVTKTARPARVSRGTGYVSVATPGGWAEVSRGGRRLGQTPLRVKLPAGRQILRLRPFGKGPARSVSVVVKRDGSERVVVPLRSPATNSSRQGAP